MSFEEFCDRLAHLRLDRSGGDPKPYKPLLIAAVTLLIGKGEILSRRIFLDGGVRSVFSQLLHAIYPNWKHRIDIRLPYRHLESDGVWSLVPASGQSEQLEAFRSLHAKARDILRHVTCAELDDEVFSVLAQSHEARLRVLEQLSQSYFPPGAMITLCAGYSARQDYEAARETPDTMNERAVEEYLWNNWAGTPFQAMGIALACPGRQVMTPINCIDLLGYQSIEKQWWVFELKKGRPADRVVGQVQRYMGWIAEAKPERKAVGVVVAGDADRKLRYAVRANPNVSLWTYDDEFRLSQVGA